MQKIDLTGFICEDIELTIDDMTFNIPTDPDVESYVYLLNYLNGKYTAEELFEVQQKLIISLIVNSTKEEVDIAKIRKLLGPTATAQFMEQYVGVLLKKGVLKKNPPEEKKIKGKSS